MSEKMLVNVEPFVSDDAGEALRMQAASWGEAAKSAAANDQGMAVGVDETVGNLASQEAIVRKSADLAEQNKFPDYRFNRVAKNEKGEIIGVVRGRVVELPEQLAELLQVSEKEGYYLSHLYVGINAQGGGIGKMMLSKFLEWATTNGERIIFTDVDSANERTNGFYEKMGFQVVPGSEHSREGSEVILQYYTYPVDDNTHNSA